MADEVVEDMVDVQVVNEDASICSAEDSLPSHSIILLNGYYVLNVPGTYSTRAADAPYTDVVLTSFTNLNCDQNMLVAAEKEYAKKIYVTNTGGLTASNKMVKGKANKDANDILKGKTITYEIIPLMVSDNNMKSVIKNGTVKSVKVLTGGKYKKVKKSMWRLDGNVLTFSGNYKGRVSLNGLN